MNQGDLAKQMNYLREHNLFFSKYFNTEATYSNEEELYDELPIITKDVIEAQIREYITSDFMYGSNKSEVLGILHDVKKLSGNYDRKIFDNGKQWILESTTGSTGHPFTIIKTQSEKLWESKYLVERRKIIDRSATIKNGFLLLEPIDPFLKEMRYRTNINLNISLILDYLIKVRPRWILCTTLVLRKLYEFIVAHQLTKQVRELKLSFIETTSQKLYEYELQEITQCFQAPVINQYGCREVWNIGYDCPAGNMHLNDQYLKVDLIDENGKIIKEQNTIGEVILTSKLHNAFPFFKYYLGDTATLHYEQCPCGCKSPVIKLCGGRKKDKLVNTKYYGTEIFRKVLRGIHYKYDEYQLSKIKIIQDDQFHLTVYALLDLKYKEAFEKTFLEITTFQIENFNNFNVHFAYAYPFENEEQKMKPEIFTNLLS